ncbi:hypothetical protein FS749_007351 [Ceratobasidium sp. UAMH 11750]|nr:hypothetical protein FS749_007351 [Ceratobasidium sp. UAMH 11750]
MARISKTAMERAKSRVPWRKFKRANEITLMDEKRAAPVADGDLIIRIMTDFTVTDKMGNPVELLPDSKFEDLVMWGTFASCSGPARHLYMAGYWDVPFPNGGGYETGIIDDISAVLFEESKIFRDGKKKVLWVQTGTHVYILTDPHLDYVPEWCASLKVWIEELGEDPTVRDVSLKRAAPSWMHVRVWKALVEWDQGGRVSSGVEVVDKGPLDLAGADCHIREPRDESDGEEVEGEGEAGEVDEDDEAAEREGKDDEDESDDDTYIDRGVDEDGSDESDESDESDVGDESDEEGGDDAQEEREGEGGVEGDVGLKKKRKLEDEDEDEDEGGDEGGDELRSRKRAKAPAPPPRSPTLDHTPGATDASGRPSVEPTPQETPDRTEAGPSLGSAQARLSEVSISGSSAAAGPAPSPATGKQGNNRFDPVRDVQAVPESTAGEAAAPAPNNNPEDLGVAPRRARR